MTELSASVGIIAQLAAHVSKQKLAATGDNLPVPDFSRWRFDVASQADLVALVTECYKWWREAWADDIQLLMDQPLDISNDDARSFTRLIRLLRTAHQHADNNDARRFYERWLLSACGSSEPTTKEQWSNCGVALGSTLAKALTTLAALADETIREPERASSWRARSRARREADPTAARVRIAQDLGLNIPRNSFGHLDRQIAYEWSQRIRTIADDPQVVLDSVTVRTLVGWSISPLPCAYTEILEKLDCWGDTRATAALMLAHAVAELVTYNDTQEFLETVYSVWTTVVESSPDAKTQ